MDKDKIISQVYNDPLGFGSNHSTLKDARKVDPSITLEDIKKWRQDNTERTTQLKCYNSNSATQMLAKTQIAQLVCYNRNNTCVFLQHKNKSCKFSFSQTGEKKVL